MNKDDWNNANSDNEWSRYAADKTGPAAQPPRPSAEARPRQVFPGEDQQPFIPAPVIPATSKPPSKFPVKTLIAVVVLVIVVAIAFAVGKVALGYLAENKEEKIQAEFDQKYGDVASYFDEEGHLSNCHIPEEYLPVGLVGGIVQAGDKSCLLWLTNGSGGPEVQAEVHLGRAGSQLVAYHRDGTSDELGDFEPTSTPPADSQLKDWTFDSDLLVVPATYNVNFLYRESERVRPNGCVYNHEETAVSITAPVNCAVLEKVVNGYEKFFETYHWAQKWTPRKGLEAPAIPTETISGFELAGYWPGIPVEEKPTDKTFTTESEAYATTEVNLLSLETTPSPDSSINAVDVCIKLDMTMKDRFENHKIRFKLPVVYAALPTGELLQITETTGHADGDRYLAESSGCVTIHGLRHAKVQLAMASMEANPDGRERGWLDGLKTFWITTV